MCKNANIRKYIDEHDALKKDVENRYDIHGKRIFETNDKFYFVTCFYSLYDICNRKNANYKTNSQAYVITKKTVTSKSVLKLNSVAGGGFAISILAQ